MQLSWTLLLIASMAGIAAMYPITKSLGGSVDPYLLAFFRFAIAAVALLPFILWRRVMTIPSVKELVFFFFIALCGVIPTALIVIGIEATNSVVASLLINTNPLIVALLAHFLVSEEITTRKMLGLSLGFLGVVAIVLNGENPFAQAHAAYLWGAMILLFAAFLSGLNKTYSRDLVRKYDGLYVTFLATLLGSLALFPYTIWAGKIAHVAAFGPREFVSLLAIGIICTAIPWTIWASSLKHLDVNVAASFNLLIPLIVTVYSFIFFDEAFTAWMFAGMLLTSIGIYIVQREEKVVATV